MRRRLSLMLCWSEATRQFASHCWGQLKACEGCGRAGSGGRVGGGMVGVRSARQIPTVHVATGLRVRHETTCPSCVAH